MIKIFKKRYLKIISPLKIESLPNKMTYPLIELSKNFFIFKTNVNFEY